MVRLKNLKKNKNTIECDFFPEDSNNPGHISVYIPSGLVIGCSYPDGYEWCLNHANHAKSELLKLAGENELPNEKLIMWN
jgi:hypothetical protein